MGIAQLRSRLAAGMRNRLNALLRRRHTVFLFGAGASAYSDSQLTCPPIGGHLFATLRKQGGVAAQISNQLAGVFNRSFENGVDQLWDVHPEYLLPLLRETSLYLAQFEPGSNNLYRHLIRFLIGTRTRAVLATINYDMLIELAVSGEGRRVAYRSFPVPHGNIPVIKIHGSINFLPKMSIRGVGFVFGRGNTVIEGAEVSIATSLREVIEWCTIEDGIAPALCLYTKRKPVLICREFVRQQQEQWFRALDDARRVYVIGVHLNPDDHHIWDVLERCRAELLYVGPEGDEVLKWAKERGRAGVQHFAKTFEDAVTRLML